jgi:hypothetical protein
MPRLIVQSPELSGLLFDLVEGEVTVGRAADNAIHIDHASLSSHHAVMQLTPTGDYSIRDLNSTNGTRINGNKIASQKLMRGDLIQLGNIEVYYDSEIGGAQQPLPDPTMGAEYGSDSSERPANFANTSPFGRKATGDGSSKVPTIVLSALGVLTAIALVLVFVKSGG